MGIEEELSELRSHDKLLLTLGERRRLDELEGLVEQKSATEDAEDAEIQALQCKKNSWTFGLIDQIRLDELLQNQCRRRSEHAEAQKSGPTSTSTPRAGTIQSGASPEVKVIGPRDLSLSDLLPSEQQAMTTVLSLLTTQIQALEAQNKALIADISKSHEATTKLETYHDALVVHARDNAKTKAMLEVENNTLTEKVTDQEQKIEKMRAMYDDVISKLRLDHQEAIHMHEAKLAEVIATYERTLESKQTEYETSISKLRAERTARSEIVAQGICDGIRTVLVGDLDTTESADGEGHPVALPRGVIVETFDSLLTDLTLERGRAERLLDRVQVLESEVEGYQKAQVQGNEEEAVCNISHPGPPFCS